MATRALVFSTAIIGSPVLAVEGAGIEPIARTQQLIDAVPGGASVFRTNLRGAAVHIQSGMTCVPGAEKMRLAGLVISPGVPTGDDAGCDYEVPDGKTTVFAARMGTRPFQSAIAGIVSTIKATFPDAKPITVPLVASYPNLNIPFGASWSCTFKGKPSITSAWLVQQGEWLVEVRATYPEGERHDPELLAAILTINAQVSISQSARP